MSGCARPRLRFPRTFRLQMASRGPASKGAWAAGDTQGGPSDALPAPLPPTLASLEGSDQMSGPRRHIISRPRKPVGITFLILLRRPFGLRRLENCSPPPHPGGRLLALSWRNPAQGGGGKIRVELALLTLPLQMSSPGPSF